jgi:hypothetical protein
MTHLGAAVLGTYSLIVTIALAIHHIMKFAKEKDSSSELIITLIIPVVIYLINVI